MSTYGKLVDIFAGAGYRNPATDTILNGGKVYTYGSGTLVAATIWTDRAKTTPAAQPFVVGSDGRAEVYGDNVYKFRIYTSADVFVEEIDGAEYIAISAFTDEYMAHIDIIQDVRDYAGDATAADVSGYYAKGDGGGGPTRYKVTGAAAGTYVDNGGSILVPTGGDGSAAWLWKHSGPINAKWFGAADVSVVADSTTFVQNILTYMTSIDDISGTIEFTEGNYILGNIVIPTTFQGLTIKGPGRARTDVTKGTWLTHDGTGYMFDTLGSTLANFTVTGFGLAQADSAAGSLIGTSSSIDGFVLEDIHFSLSNPASSLVDFDPFSVAMCTFSRIRGTMAAAASVPSINIACGVGKNTFGFNFENVMINSNDTATAPIIKIADNSGGATSGPHNFKNVILEVCTNGGGIHLYSVRHPLFQTCRADDGSTNGAPIIFIDTSAIASSQNPLGSTFIDCILPQGDATYPDIKVVAGAGGTQTILIGSEVDYLDTGNKAAVNIGSRIVNNVGTKGAVTIFSGIMSHPNGITIPETQSGVTGVLATTASEVIVFPIEFSGIPNVTLGHGGSTARDAPPTVASITTTGCTIYSWATADSTIQWDATYSP